MEKTLSFIRNNNWIAMTIAVVAGVLLVVGGVQAATTISTNIETDGTLEVTGASTLTGLTTMIQASSTRFSVHGTAYFGGTATSTFDSAGNLTVVGTLGVTGLTTLTGASTTRISLTNNLMVNGMATTTGSSGSIATEGDLTVLGTASTTALKVGATANTITDASVGICVPTT